MHVKEAGPLLRKVGQDGPRIPAVGLGLMGVSLGYGPIDDDTTRLELLDRAWKLGCTNWDTADVYGDSEDLIGQWFKLHPERRKDIFLATKFGLREENGAYVMDSDPDYCRKSIDRSLERLGVDFIDLYYLHRPNSDIPIEKTVEAMKELVEQGKVQYLGLSEISSSTLRRAHAVHPIAAVQVEYSPWSRDIEGTSGTFLLKTCEELSVSIFAFSPLGSGMLTGRYRNNTEFTSDDFRVDIPRYQSGNLQQNLALVDKFVRLAEQSGHHASQLTLAWLLAQSETVFVIPGTRKVKYLEENWGAASVRLTEQEVAAVRQLVEDIDMSGERDKGLGHYMDTAPLA